MTIGKYLTGGAWAALAAALALTAMPASAAPENMGRNWDRGSSARGEARAARQERSGGERASPRQAPQPRPAPQAQQRGENRAPVAEQRSGRDWNRGDRRADTAQQRSGREWNRSAGQPPVAQQQPRRQRNDGNWNRGGDNRGAVAGTDRNRSYTNRDRNRSYDGRRDGDGRRDNNRSWSGNDRRDNDRNWGDRNGSYRGGYADARRDHRRWDNRGWRNDRRYDWNRYRSANRNVFRLGAYYSPYRNYSYRRLSIGFFLDSLFYSNRYWINDPWRYRLPEVYGPYRWVRYYDDALLVDVYSGEVVDVIHDFFW